MKWFKYLIAFFLLLLCLPAWRLIDWAIVTIPYTSLFTFLMASWSLVFLLFPLKLLIPRLHPVVFLLMLLMVGTSAWLSTPFSAKATLEPELNHCGRASYTGFFYDVRGFLSNAHHDDLEVRNQICWIVKMIKRAPDKINEEEFAQHEQLLKNKLLKPAQKYRASLPWVMILYGNYLAALDRSNDTLSRLNTSKTVLDAGHFWHELYSEQISEREYSLWNWPHSNYIKMEYGLIEKNWSQIVFELKMQSP